jgi:hypothetical protein
MLISRRTHAPLMLVLMVAAAGCGGIHEHAVIVNDLHLSLPGPAKLSNGEVSPVVASYSLERLESGFLSCATEPCPSPSASPDTISSLVVAIALCDGQHIDGAVTGAREAGPPYLAITIGGSPQNRTCTDTYSVFRFSDSEIGAQIIYLQGATAGGQSTHHAWIGAPEPSPECSPLPPPQPPC